MSSHNLSPNGHLGTDLYKSRLANLPRSWGSKRRKMTTRQEAGAIGAGWERANGTANAAMDTPQHVGAAHITGQSPKKTRRRKSTQSNPPSVMSSTHSSSGDIHDESSYSRSVQKRPDMPDSPQTTTPPVDMPTRRASLHRKGGSDHSLLRDDTKKGPSKNIKAVGTLNEVVEASKNARLELLPFVQTALPPTTNLAGAFSFGLATFNLRHLFQVFPCLKRFVKPFTREMINLGGLERRLAGQNDPPPAPGPLPLLTHPPPPPLLVL